MFAAAAGALDGSLRLITYDRRGWGRSTVTGEYRRTSIAEQSIEAAGMLREIDPGPVRVIGLGLGGVVGLELALAEPELITAVDMIEPPVFGPLAAATEGMSADVAAIRAAAETGGEHAAFELYLGGALNTLGAGAERFSRFADRGPGTARAFLVELPAVPAWPLDPVRLAGLEAEVGVVTSPSTPALLGKAADALVTQVPGAKRIVTTREPELAPVELLDSSRPA
ncbi:MAG: alpha/beta fold hydrolase [Actinomycetota bacterium]|nr:alpha/beta fold hydrolase [Actinomycetota bacterium]